MFPSWSSWRKKRINIFRCLSLCLCGDPAFKADPLSRPATSDTTPSSSTASCPGVFAPLRRVCFQDPGTAGLTLVSSRGEPTMMGLPAGLAQRAAVG